MRKLCNFAVSLSARRAWIEMISHWTTCAVALVSLSARRAWIEMLFSKYFCPPLSRVALRKESVD